MKLQITTPAQWVDNERVAASWDDGGFQRFVLTGRTDVISAERKAGYLYLAPERSAQHKALLVALTVEVE